MRPPGGLTPGQQSRMERKLAKTAQRRRQHHDKYSHKAPRRDGGAA